MLPGNVGVDFGSTYSMVSYMKQDGTIELFNINGSLSGGIVPSFVAIDKESKEVFYGAEAKSLTSDSDYVVYDCFKMLMNVDITSPETKDVNKKLLAAHNYIGNITPELISKLYISYLMNSILETGIIKHIDRLVIGVPECWKYGTSTMDACAKLMRICKSIEILKNTEIKFVCEPINAAALCAWNYKNSTNEVINGNILVVDYGGGTLDVTSLSVEELSNGKLQIKILNRDGEGENKNGRIGAAGIEFQKEVIRIAISESASFDKSNSQKINSSFNKAVYDLENKLMTGKNIITKALKKGNGSTTDVEKTVGNILTECGSIEVKYRHLVQAFKNVILDNFTDVLNRVLNSIDNTKPIYYALVGGFSAFYLVSKHAENILRERGFIIVNESDLFRSTDERERAISYGATLFSNDMIELCDTAPYSLGFQVGNAYRYAIKRGQVMEKNKPCYIQDEYGSPLPLLISDVSYFVFNPEFDDNLANVYKPSERLHQRLITFPREKNITTALIGFTIDDSELLTLRFYSYKINGNRAIPDKELANMPLSTWHDIFPTNMPLKIRR